MIAAVIAALLAAACKRTPPPAPSAPAEAGADPVVDASVTTVAPDAAATPDADPDAAWVKPAVKRAKSIGNTSVVLKLELADGKKAAFKPQSHRGPGRYKGEIAAYRLGVALGLSAVPVAYFRTVDRAELAAASASDAKAEKLVHDEVVADHGVVRGAIIPWIDGYEVFRLEEEPLFSEVKGWLRAGSTIPPERRELVRETSDLFVFDFLTGNWDRWSGFNVATAHGKMLYVDNDGAFFESPPKDALARNERLVRGADRFSRRLVDRLREMSDDDVRHAIGEETPGVPLLSDKALAGVLARKKQLSSILDAKTIDWLP